MFASCCDMLEKMNVCESSSTLKRPSSDRGLVVDSVFKCAPRQRLLFLTARSANNQQHVQQFTILEVFHMKQRHSYLSWL